MRTKTLLIATALALSVPMVSAIGQTASSGLKCGPVAFSSRDMTYSSAPCTAETPGAVGTSGPTVFGANNSSSMTKAEMKQGMPVGQQYAPMPMQQAQAVSMGPSPGMAPMMSDQCGPANVPAIRDEYGRRYNCRGDRIR